MSEKLWTGRFTEKTDRLVEDFTSSIDIDKRLYSYDIEGSIAHCRMLAKVSIISEEDATTLIEGLGLIKREIDRGEFQFDNSLEDIHMHIETRLMEKVGKTAQKLHTARSRNDQVALDVRMYLRDETSNTVKRLVMLKKVLVDLAKINIDVVMPGYTHLQRAQPVLLSHYFMAYYEMFSRDVERFDDCLKRINVMPLGSAALAGTTYPIDRVYTASLLDFPKISANSMDAVSDRDFIIEFISAASICMVHLSRMSEELILWSSSEFGFIELPDSFATGSSIMPQKKNPDVAELARGKTGRVYGSLLALLTTMKGLPLAYNHDMQEDKQGLFDTVDTLLSTLEVFAGMVRTLKVKAENTSKAVERGYILATDLADYLVKKGEPFRTAHEIVGRLVSYAAEKGKPFAELGINEYKKFSPLFGEDVRKISIKSSLAARDVVGGTAPGRVKQALARARKAVGE